MARPVFEVVSNYPTLQGVLEEFPVVFAAEYADRAMFTAAKPVIDRFKTPDYIFPDRTGTLRSTIKRRKTNLYGRQFTDITIGSPRTREYAPVVLFHQPFTDEEKRERARRRGELRSGRFGRRRSRATVNKLLGEIGYTSPRIENPLQQVLSQSRIAVGESLERSLDPQTIRKMYDRLRAKQMRLAAGMRNR